MTPAFQTVAKFTQFWQKIIFLHALAPRKKVMPIFFADSESEPTYNDLPVLSPPELLSDRLKLILLLILLSEALTVHLEGLSNDLTFHRQSTNHGSSVRLWRHHIHCLFWCCLNHRSPIRHGLEVSPLGLICLIVTTWTSVILSWGSFFYNPCIWSQSWLFKSFSFFYHWFAIPARWLENSLVI